MSAYSHGDIVRVLVREALDDAETGWLSDMGKFDLAWDSSNQAIGVWGGGEGSIDVSHLASIVQAIIAGEYQT